MEVRPQEGFQEDFLSSTADIVIGGSGAGVGKTFALLCEAVRHQSNKDFGATIFRRTYVQITNEGGLWDTSEKLYPLLQAKPNQNDCEWSFPSGARIKFSHLQHEKNKFDYQGSQIPLIGFDELTHFSESMFWYMLSRNRSTCGVRPYVRCTCNPDPDSWVARLIEWWIDPVTGFPVPERSGVLRYFTRDNDMMVWGDTPEEVLRKIPHVLSELPADIDRLTLVKSMTFIAGNIYQNKVLLKVNPQYLGDLLAQDESTKLQLLHGNWKVKVDTESMIQYNRMLDAFTNEHVKDGTRYITADIALHGSDLFVLFVWSGMRVIDVRVVKKSEGNDVENIIKALAQQYSVGQSNICFDADGVGAYLRGYLKNAVPFNNGAAPIAVAGSKVNYKNLKTQCYYLLAQAVNDVNIFITPKVAETMLDGKFVRDKIVSESRAIKRFKPDHDGKLQIIPKEQMKNILGHSPDFLDALMMRMIFNI